MKSKKDLIQWLEENQQPFIEMSDKIWEYAEVSWKEFKSSRLQAEFLEKEGFSIDWDIDGMNTAFIASFGESKPIIGFAGEYDALEGLSQKNQPTQEPIEAGAPGHGCGHNLLGTGCLASAVAVKRWLEATGTPGTVQYFGCPAEEGGSAKAYMARAGLFDNLDAAFNFHPSYANFASKGSCVGVNCIYFRFKGKSAHAGGSPHLGRSALDAVELMNVGVNYLREHVTDKVRIHYIISKGGDAPNIVPENAEVFYYVRAHMPDELEDVTNRVRKVAQGAAMMTETTFEEVFESATLSVLNNQYLSDLQFKAMELIGPIPFDEEEMTYAQIINDQFPKENVEALFKMIHIPKGLEAKMDALRGKSLLGDNFPALDEGIIETGSTDVGDMSWVTPLSMLNTACWPTAAPGHNWGNVATGAMSIGHKGMMHAAKIMAVAALDLYTDPLHLEKIREEFNKARGGLEYICPLPADMMPPVYEPEE
ncbi:MAG: amidohydrolase [Anaerolineaceae bacterium]|nr:amidohydrolase [Anaerolineaceae bacterium]